MADTSEPTNSAGPPAGSGGEGGAAGSGGGAGSVPAATLWYFPFQGRAEPLRLALAAAGVPFRFVPVEAADSLKDDLEHYHFGQVPRYVDDEVDLCQSGAILRHIGRRHGLYGSSRAEAARVDEVIDGSTDLASSLFLECINKGGHAAAENWFSRHVSEGSAAAATARGAHAAYLSRLLGMAGSGWFLGSGLSVADIQVAVVVQLMFRVFGRERVGHEWPDLEEHSARLEALPRVAAYLASPQRPPLISPMLP